MKKIEAVRRSRGLSQTQLAAWAGMHQPAVSMVECGRLIPTPAEAERLASVLGLRADELLNEATRPRAPALREVRP